MEEWICTIPNTGRVVVALIIIGESTPLRSSVDDTITKYETARGTNHIA
jgi:hypothetical protein